MSWLSKALGGSKPSIQTTTIEDPAKTAVSGPLSSYLASEVGKGLPLYQDSPSISPDATNRYSEFMKLNANDYFDKYVDQPQTKSFRENLLPTITEGYAGSLRGSGRFASEEGAINKFEQDLSGLQYKANTEIPQAQMDATVKYYTLQMEKQKQDYKQWSDSLPENNPVLKQAMEFLSPGTDTGKTLITQGVPGAKGGAFDLLGTLFGSGQGQISAGSIASALGPVLSAAGTAAAGAGASIMGALSTALAFL